MLKSIIVVIIGYLSLSEHAVVVPRIEDAKFWRTQGEKHLKNILNMSNQKDMKVAKNIIIFIGDGMGMTSITAGRIYKGQKNGQLGEEASLNFDNFPNIGLAKTYNVDKQVPDSAGTATALFCGVKTNYGVLGMDATNIETDAERGKLTSIMDWAQSIGKRTGIVTTTRITHATPAALYSNTHNRDWECDREIPEESVGIFKDIGRQLIEDQPGTRLNVIMGGGKSALGATENEPPLEVEFTGPSEHVCSRSDGRNLTDEWLDLSPNRTLALSRQDLLSIDATKTNHLMGIFTNNHLTFRVGRPVEREPALTEMVDKALDVLIRPQSKGFVLLIEAGRIDQAHHQNYAKAAMEEILEMDEAIGLTLSRTDPSDTLVIVTADHSHAMTLNGYPDRGTDILGFANKANVPPYETITYANGPGFFYHRLNVTSALPGNFQTWRKVESIAQTDRDAPNYRHLAAFPMKEETHGGEDIPVYAFGPGAELVRGSFEQNYVAYVISYAGCFGPALHLNKKCSSPSYSKSISDGKIITPSRTVLSVIVLYSVSYFLM